MYIKQQEPSHDSEELNFAPCTRHWDGGVQSSVLITIQSAPAAAACCSSVSLRKRQQRTRIPLAMQLSPIFTTQFSDPHFDLSAYTFARDTIPFNNISFALDLLTHDKAATQNLLILD